MRFDTSMHLRLDQRMTLAPRMIQSMEILQLPLLALEERIQEELVSNPVLEISENEDQPDEEQASAEKAEPAGETSQEQVAEEERELTVDEKGGAEEFERLESMSNEWEDFYREDYVPKSRAASGERDAKLDAMANTPAPGENLGDVLLDQFSFFTTDEIIHDLGQTIIRNLDNIGYLRVPLEDVLQDIRGEATLAQAEEALRLIQRLEPAGVGARDLAECLVLQLDRHGRCDPLVRKIIADHLHDIEGNRYPLVAKKLGVDIEDVKAAVEEISHLNPKPGASITREVVPYIVPDVQIVRDEKTGEYVVIMRDERTPRLMINRVYRTMLRNRGLDAKTREFVTRNVRSARWLIEAIEQRRNTLTRVVKSIITFQRPFLDKGPDHLKPLKMQQVADDVGLHVGTISRAVDGKYAETSWGIFALRGFFTGGTENANGEVVAWDNVRTRLKQLVDEEDKSKPLSDEELVEKFKSEGIELARRTVAKYRKILNIPSSRRRKEY
jgi:RNA polymerase sigma-54 factor